MKPAIAYISPFDGCAYLITNPMHQGEGCLSMPYGKEGSLTGYGNPACCPNYQKQNPGSGQLAMDKKAISEQELKGFIEKQKVEETVDGKKVTRTIDTLPNVLPDFVGNATSEDPWDIMEALGKRIDKLEKVK